MSAVPDPLAAPTWITAIFTVVLAVGAVVTAIFAIKAFGKQSAELTILKDQLTDQRVTNSKLAAAAELQAEELRESLAERKLAREQEHRAQAEQVYVTLTRTPARPASGPGDEFIYAGFLPDIAAVVHNYSQQIIREVELRWHKGSASHGDPNPEPLGELIPGADAVRERLFPVDADIDQCGAVVVFRDASGTKWLRRPDGDLQEQD